MAGRRASRKTAAARAESDAVQTSGVPSKDDILRFIRSQDDQVGKREIAKAFGLKGEDKRALKDLLKDMQREGLLERGHGKSLDSAEGLPNVAVIEVIDRDTDGELIARPVNWKKDTPPPRILLAPGSSAGGATGAAVGIGDKVLARIMPGEEIIEAKVIKRLGQSAHKILGIFEPMSESAKSGGRVRPVDRKAKGDLIIAAEHRAKAQKGELVLAEMLPGKAMGQKRGRIMERLGDMSEPRSVSLIAIYAHGIPVEFSQEALEEVEGIAPITELGKRTDLRQMPLITIDPADARDHDDAVYAEPDTDPENEGGHVVYVAIADVAAYVRPGRPLDKDAHKRGNSCYFPDRVVPMLPERLSADLCSLHEHEDRPCLAVRMVFNKDGRKIGHEFVRGMMRSAASLTYEQAQNAVDGNADDQAGPLLEPVLKPLWAAYRAVEKARAKRGPLDLDLPEHQVRISPEGQITAITLRERFDAHKLIEEFMIQANVCAAETLEQKRSALLYRVHDAPDKEKLRALSEYLETMGISLSKGQTIKPEHFNRILNKVQGTEHSQMVSEVILRAQSQAIYSPDNLGHFGLNLRRYAHFTSPIRRYADLIVHRGLIAACKLGQDGLTAGEAEAVAEIGEHISMTERRAMAAERDSTNRYLAAYLSDQVGAAFNGRISGVTRFGLFVRLEGSGADGIVPISHLGNEFFHHDEDSHALVGEKTGATYRLGEPVEVRLIEAAPITGGLRFELLSEPGSFTKQADRPRGGPKSAQGPGAHRGRTSTSRKPANRGPRRSPNQAKGPKKKGKRK